MKETDSKAVSGKDESKIADDTKSELVLVREEIAKKETKVADLMVDFKGATTPTKKQFFSKRVEATEAELATLRDTEKELVLRSTAPP